MPFINKIIESLITEDEEVFEEEIYPTRLVDLETDKAMLKHLSKHPAKSISTNIICSENAIYNLPISETVHVLPDKTGFMIIYGDKPSKFSKETTEPWFFKMPNNAAIYNADCTLRKQVISPNGREIYQVVSAISEKYPHHLHVILNSKSEPNNTGFYHLYAVDSESGKLLITDRMIKF